jgi:hypothetical protein
MYFKTVSLIAFLCLTNYLPSISQTAKTEKIKLFLDCSSTRCDRTYIRTEINLVDFVNNRTQADVHLLLTDQRAGNGGRTYQLIFFGQNDFSGKRDTLSFSMPPSATDVEYREKLLNLIKIGLVPYVAQTSWINEMMVAMKADGMDADEYEASRAEDKWDYWVFRVGGRGNLSEDQNYKETELNSYISVNRTVPENRTELRVGYGRERSDFEYVNDDGTLESYSVRNSNWYLNHLFVNSFSEHWSYGYYLFVRNSTFSNYQHSVRARPAIEYNFFPYSEVNTKYFALSYMADVRNNSYYEETIYDKNNEWLYGHRAQAVVSFKQRWGNLSSTASYFNYFHDWSQNSIQIDLNADVRVKGNLSFFVNFYGSLSRNQVFIAKGESSVEDVLARRKQLASGYEYGTWFGINYRFGSINNSFINPRFSDEVD